MTPAQDPQPHVVMIDQSTIYNLLLEVRDKVREVDTKVDHLIEDNKDHEERIRSLEQRKTIAPWQLWTAVCGGVALFGSLMAILRGMGVG